MLNGCSDRKNEKELVNNGEFVYQLYKGNATIVSGQCETDTLIVPEEIDGYPVVGILTDAYDCTDVVEIILPESLELIEENAFRNCEELLDLSIAGSTSAARGFENMEKLKTLTILKGTGAMHDYELSFDAPWHDSFYNITTLNLADGITHIGDNSFSGFMSVRYLSIPHTVESIGEAAFTNFLSLRRLEIPNSVKVIEERAFFNDPLESRSISVIVPKYVEEIGDMAFSPDRTYYAYKDSDGASNLAAHHIAYTEIDYSFTEENYKIRVGQTSQLQFREAPEFILLQTKYESSDESIARVSGDGMITAYKEGEVTITAHTETAEIATPLKVYDNPLARYDVRYRRVAVADSVDLDPAEDFECFKDYAGEIEYSYLGNDFRISNKGKLTAVKKGKGLLIVSGDGNRKGEYIIETYNPVTQVTVKMPDMVMLKDRDYHLQTSVYPASADDLNLEFTSLDNSVVKVDYTGTVTAVEVGEATVLVQPRDGSQNGTSVNVKVMNDGVDLAIWAMPMKTGTRVNFDYDYDFKYYSSDESIVTISEDGELKALREGECYIILYLEDKSLLTFCDIKVSNEPFAYGIDISNWNDSLSNNDWENIRNYGIEFAIIRAGYGPDFKDEEYEDYYERGKKVGMPLGAYHYVIALTEEEAVEEAEAMLGYLEGKQLEYPIVMDFEEPEQRALDYETFNSVIDTYCSILTDAGYKVAIYSNASMLTKLSPMNQKKYDIWQAHWNVTEPNLYEGDYTIWQYTSTGHVWGINGNVDMNLSYFDYPSYMKANHLNGY